MIPTDKSPGESFLTNNSVNQHSLDDHVAVDCVIFGYDFKCLNVLLVDRVLKDPDSSKIIFSDLTLTGNHVKYNEPLDTAANRILEELTGISNIYLEQFYTFGDPDRLRNPNDQLWIKACGRDPDARIISIGYYALLNNTEIRIRNHQRKLAWYPVKEVSGLAFDHDHILERALKTLREKIKHQPMAYELLPDKFTLSQLQRLYEIILDQKLDKRNFRKKVNRYPYIIPLEEKQVGVAHKPARLYTFDREKYQQYDDLQPH